MDNTVNMNNLELMKNKDAQKIILDRFFHSSATDEPQGLAWFAIDKRVHALPP